jgi:hypothetical protein
VNSPTHVILCGRAGYEYEFVENDDGKKELAKTGIKMKAEGETGFEPSLLVLMERHMDMESKKAFRVATVLKDRSTVIDGAQITNPTFADFIPHIKHLNLGGRQLGVDGATSDALIPGDDFNRASGPVQRRIVVDEISRCWCCTSPASPLPTRSARSSSCASTSARAGSRSRK